MFDQIYLSNVPPYVLPGASDIATVDSVPAYNSYLTTPPRIYAEELDAPIALFVNRERTPYSDWTIHLVAVTKQIYFPSYNHIRWRFDGMTGAYLSRQVGIIGDLIDYQIYQSRDGSLWRVSVTGPIFEVDPSTFEEIDDTRQLPAKYGLSSLDMPLVDRAQNLIVMRKSDETGVLGVWNFTTGALIRRIVVSGPLADIVPEDERRCYVLTTHNLLNLVDYSTGKILATLKAPGDEAGSVARKLCWDRYLRRLLIFTQRANDTDGACLSTIAGYYPKPLAVGVTKAIPLWPPRAGRVVPCLTRAYGDAGEGIPGLKFAPEFSGDASFVGAPPAADIDGHAIVNALCDAEGSATLDLSAEV